MKYDYLFEMDKLYKAFKKSKNRRSYTKSAVSFENDVFINLKQLQTELLDKTYEVSGYTEFEVTSPKQRNIKACKFRDKIVQHVICDNVLAPELKNICIVDNYAGQVGKGTSFARKRTVENIERFYKNNGIGGYFYKGDIHKYYYSINHEIAKEKMHRCYDEGLWWLIDKFIESTSDSPETGLALGNQINTIISCLYLDDFDKFVTEELGIEYYGRYADDFYLICKDKTQLRDCVNRIREYLDSIKLELNPKSQIISFKTGLTFIGFNYRIRDHGIEIKLDNGKKRAYRRKFNKLVKKVRSGEIPYGSLLKSYRSWKNHAKVVTDKSIFAYYETELKYLRKELGI